MAKWRLRDPGSFPPSFHDAMRAGEGKDKLVVRRFTEASIRADAEDFRIFRFSLRHHPAHSTAAWETKLKHRTRVAWNPLNRQWELLLTSRRSVLEDIVKME
jgi:hypothetical protein